MGEREWKEADLVPSGVVACAQQTHCNYTDRSLQCVITFKSVPVSVWLPACCWEYEFESSRTSVMSIFINK